MDKMVEVPAPSSADVEPDLPSTASNTWSGLSGGSGAARIALLILKWILLVGLAIFILGPLIVMAIWAFAGEWTGTSLLPQVWSLKWWPDVWGLSGITDSIVLSLQTATLVTLLSTLICLPAAYAFARFRFPGRQPLLLSFLAANAFPKFGLYVTILTVFYRVNLDDSVAGIVLIQILETLVFMIWIPASAFQNIDRSLEEAAMDAGCSRAGTFFRITLPLALPSIAVAMLLSFVAALDESQGTLLVGLPDHVTMPLIMYNAVNSYAQPEGAVFALMLSVPSLLLLALAQWIARGRGLRIFGAA